MSGGKIKCREILNVRYLKPMTDVLYAVALRAVYSYPQRNKAVVFDYTMFQ